MISETQITVTRLLEFDAGHRVMNHESKCATLHGHRYKIEVEASAKSLDEIGRVIDFSVIKEKLGTWIDTHWDHTCLIHQADTVTLAALNSVPKFKPVFVCEWNPTAENMAAYLLNVICPLVFKDTGIEITQITVWETPNCKAVAKKK